MSAEMTPAEEVAEDYRRELEDLSGNLRHEISGLTLIARESIEHAKVIADVLQQHILKTAPTRKLPALYLLDSIVKNIGTPYTLYFGRNLYKIFMESYAMVDANVRRKMEEMLRTWREPVPGSRDTRPVFPLELVRPIENALLKARNSTIQAEQNQTGRAHTPHQRDSPMPPNSHTAQYAAKPFPYPEDGHPGEPGTIRSPHPHGEMPFSPPQPPPHPQTMFAAPTPPSALPHYGITRNGASPSGVGLDRLHEDIQDLIRVMQDQFNKDPYNTSISQKLAALVKLKNLLASRQLAPEHLAQVRNQVAAEMTATIIAGAPAFAPGPNPMAVPMSVPVPVRPAAAAPAPAPPVTLDSILGKGSLARLMAVQDSLPPAAPSMQGAITAQAPLPPRAEPSGLPSLAPAAPIPPPAAPRVNPMDLVEQLRRAGLLPAVPAPTPAPAPANPPPPPLPITLPSILASVLAGASKHAPPRTPLQEMNVMPLDAAFLKNEFKPHLLAQLYGELGPPCTQCGVRFATTDAGKKKKIAHLDWHFHIHLRTGEAEKRGQHRSWYVDVDDWVKSREVVDPKYKPGGEDAAAQDYQSSKPVPPAYIPVPDSASGINAVCPICQDRFDNKWLDEVQEWVWLDVVLVQGRAYHISCHSEATLDRASGPRGTPEPASGLGRKRKAEGELYVFGAARAKREEL